MSRRYHMGGLGAMVKLVFLAQGVWFLPWGLQGLVDTFGTGECRLV